MTERFEFQTCLGLDFYDDLLADQVDYSDESKWSPGAYSENDVVLYDGIYYKANTDTSNEPQVSSDWDEAPKFTTACYNDLWCDYLGPYLSYAVARDTIPMMATQLKNKGLVKHKGEDYNPANHKDVATFKGSVEAEIKKIWQMMDYWIKSEDEDGSTCFTNYMPILESCEECEQETNDWNVY